MATQFSQEQTAQLVLKGSQTYVRMTFFHNKTATTESNPKEVLFQIEKFKAPAWFQTEPTLPAQMARRPVSDLVSPLLHFALLLLLLVV